MKNKIFTWFFELWLFLHSKSKSEITKSRVYDHLGIIDTLGFNAETNKYTYSYNDELVSFYGIKLFNYSVRYTNSCGVHDISLFKGNTAIKTLISK